jgi:lysophospholipase L1-like esterase
MSKYSEIIAPMPCSAQVGIAPPLATTVFFGANDAALLGRTGERQHVPVAEYKENLKKIVNHLKASSFHWSSCS